MELTAINSFVDLFSKLGVNLAGLAVVALGALIWYRTRSMHMVLTRLWLLFNGNQDCKIKSINDFLEAQSAVLRFRFMTGIRARTLTHTNRIISWAKRNDEDVADIAACGQYFDLEKPALKPETALPKRWTMGLCTVTVIVLGLAIVAGIGTMFMDRAILRMKDSGTIFLMDARTASRLSFNATEPVRLQDCPTISASDDNGFTNSDLKHICDWAKQPGTQKYIAETVSDQRWVLLYLVGLVTYLWLPSYLLLRTMMAAKDMQKRLKKRRGHRLDSTIEQRPPATRAAVRAGGLR